RLLERALQEAAPLKSALLFDARACALRSPGGAWVWVAMRPISNLLGALVRGRIERPGAPLSLGELFAAGWPGERATPTAAKNRVHVALSALRNLGVRKALLMRDGGHLIDPSLLVVEVRRPELAVRSRGRFAKG